MIRRLAGPLAVLALLLPAAPAHADTEQVSMAQYAFGPSALTVHVGDTVTWTNHDQAPHDVTTTSAPVAIHSPTLATGQSFTYTFTQPGTYSYYCSVHPDMRAQLTVLAAPTTQPAPRPTTASRVITVPQHHQQQPPATTSAPAAAPMTMATTTTPPAPQVVTAAPAAQTTLDPMLLVAGLVAAVATLCLLLIGSRPTA